MLLGTGVYRSDLITLLGMKRKLYSKYLHASTPGFVHNCITMQSLVLKITLIRAKRNFKLSVIINNARDENGFFLNLGRGHPVVFTVH